MLHLSKTLSILEEDLDEMVLVSLIDNQTSNIQTVETESINSSEVSFILPPIKNEYLERDQNIQNNIINNVNGIESLELYEEIIFEILNNIGCPLSHETSQESLLDYARNAFGISVESHEELLEIAYDKNPPKHILNVEVIKAENLLPMDSNGLADPFVTLYLKLNPNRRFNTHVQYKTLNPVWNEHFSFPLKDDPKSETLIVEVWDFDSAETYDQKLHKLLEVKGRKGLQKWIKEITHGTRRTSFKFIGEFQISLGLICSSNASIWYQLEKGSRATQTRGSVLMNIMFKASKDKQVACKEHQNLIRILLMYELETLNDEKYFWKGYFNKKAEAIIIQHYIQSGLTELDGLLCQWDTYTSVHEFRLLSFSFFHKFLEKLIETDIFAAEDSEDLRKFWEGSKKLIPSCFNVVKNIRRSIFVHKKGINMLGNILDILKILDSLKIPPDINLFWRMAYDWLAKEDAEGFKHDIKFMLIDTIKVSASEFVKTTLKSFQGENLDAIQKLTKLVISMHTDIEKAVEHHDKHFQQILNLEYVKILYHCHHESIFELCKPKVIEACENLSQCSNSSDELLKFTEIEEYTKGLHLFKLYISLGEFFSHRPDLWTTEESKEYHKWFKPAIGLWMNISQLKAVSLIKKSIDLDELKLMHEKSRHSSSAVHTLTILYQIKYFWDQLDWPNIEEWNITKIVDIISKCCAFYAKKIADKVRSKNAISDELPIIKLWCISICNLDFIQKNLLDLFKNLESDMIKKFENTLNVAEIDRCSLTLKSLIENAKENVQNQKIDFLLIFYNEMFPVMQSFLSNLDKHGLFLNLKFIFYILYSNLDEENFEKIVESSWENILGAITELLQNYADKRMSPEFFAGLQEVLSKISSLRCFEDRPISNSTINKLKTTEQFLNLHSSDTNILIHKYYQSRLKCQTENSITKYGQLTIKAHIHKSDKEELIISILNAKDLLPINSKKTCDSFVKISFFPKFYFEDIPFYKTAVQPKTLFPLYDEEINLPLLIKEHKNNNNLIVFRVKDKDRFGMLNQFLGECYLSFEDLLKLNGQQVRLNLSKPEYSGESEIIKVLEFRQRIDKTAKLFLKKLKQYSK